MADLAEQQFIPGQIPIAINHTYTTTVENFSVNKTRASAVATGFAGNYAKRTGVPQYTFDFDMPPLATGGQEVPSSVLRVPFTLTYFVGDQQFQLDGCEANDESLTVAMQQGNTTQKFRGNALSRTPE